MGEVTSTDLKLSRLCRLPVTLRLPDLMTTMLMLMLDDRNDKDGLHVKVGKESRSTLFVLKDELGPVIAISFYYQLEYRN